MDIKSPELIFENLPEYVPIYYSTSEELKEQIINFKTFELINMPSPAFTNKSGGRIPSKFKIKNLKTRR